MAARDYYSILGVSRTATEKEIKSAYRKLARKYHPDVNPGDKAAEETFKEVSEAYEVLSNKDLRRKYDQYGHLGGDVWRHADEAGFGAGGPGGFGGFGGAGGPRARRGTPEDFDTMGGDFSDILASMFGGRGGGFGRRPRGPMRGDDAQHEVEITLEEAYAGAERSFTMNAQEVCPTCHGSGMYNERPCPTCLGAGAVERQQTITVKIPKGVKDGAKIRLAGKGQPGVNGGPAGDLYLIPRVLPHARFTREGDDLAVDAPVPYLDAALGGQVQVPTLAGGTLTVTIPPGASTGARLRLRGKGMPRLKGDEHGDLYVRVMVTVPKTLGERERELLGQIRGLRS